MFNFLKLHFSSSGDARRHVPFESIIHKHILTVFFISILFISLCFRPYAAEALAQLTPEIQPVYETTIESLYDFVKVQLDDTHKQVFDLLLGSYMVGFAGMADYKLNYVYNSQSPVKEWLINSGAELYNSILSLGGIPSAGTSNLIGVPNIGYQNLSPMLQVAMGCAIKSKSYSSVDDALSDINNSDNYPIPLNVDIMYSLNSVFGYYKGLSQWQYHEADWFSYNYPWEPPTSSGSNLIEYNNAVDLLNNPRPCYKFGAYSDDDAGYVADVPVNLNYSLFIDTHNNTVSFVDSTGEISPSISTNVVYQRTYGTYYVTHTSKTFNFNRVYYDPNNFTNYSDIASYYLNLGNSTGSIWAITRAYGSSANKWAVIYPVDYFNGNVYYGNSWNNKTLLNNQSDLNLERPEKPTFLQGVENGLLDLKGLLEDIIGNLELNPPVINNYYYPDGSNVPEADIEPAIQDNNIPDSGVDIDQDLFAPLFLSDGKQSYISYLWYMTKPLILYTKDLFSCLVFDSVADFAASGPGYFVYGVVGLGLISGLLVKCLL